MEHYISLINLRRYLGASPEDEDLDNAHKRWGFEKRTGPIVADIYRRHLVANIADIYYTPQRNYHYYTNNHPNVYPNLQLRRYSRIIERQQGSPLMVFDACHMRTYPGMQEYIQLQKNNWDNFCKECLMEQ